MLCRVQHLTLLWNFTQSSNPFTYNGDGEMMFWCFLLINWFKFSLFIPLCSNKLLYVRSFIINEQTYLILLYINLIKIPDYLGWEGLTLVCSQSKSIVELFILQCHEHVLTMGSQKAKSMTHTRDGVKHSLIHHYIFSIFSNQDSSRLFSRWPDHTN